MRTANQSDGRKQDIREQVWAQLEQEGAARFPGARGRIPNFAGAEDAAARLAALGQWRDARMVKANPDSPQLPVRRRALAQGKHLAMAVPRLASHHPFLMLDPEHLSVPPRRAASIRGATREGQRVGVAQMPRFDLVVCGSVAVTRQGARVGKGGGFSDLELALLIEAGCIDDHTLLVSTVHPLQILDGELPETGHDFRLDRIVTSEQVIRCPHARRPPGLLWEHLDAPKIAAVPALTELAQP